MTESLKYFVAADDAKLLSSASQTGKLTEFVTATAADSHKKLSGSQVRTAVICAIFAVLLFAAICIMVWMIGTGNYAGIPLSVQTTLSQLGSWLNISELGCANIFDSWSCLPGYLSY